MNSENSNASDPQRLLLNLSDKINFKRSGKCVALSNLAIIHTKGCTKTNKKKSVPAWNNKFDLPDRSYSLADTQDYFEYIIKKIEAVTNNPLIRIHVNKIIDRITFKMKTIYYLELLTTEITQKH